VPPSQVSLELMGRGAFAAAVMALLLVAAMAAIMSTADSSLMAITNIAANDLFRRVRCFYPPTLSHQVLLPHPL